MLAYAGGGIGSMTIMEKKKFLLLYPGAFFSPDWGRQMEIKPHLVYVYTFLQRFFEVIVLDMENEFLRPGNKEALNVLKKKALERVMSIDADYLGISCWSSLNYLSSKFFAEEIKKIKPRMPIIVGGYHPTVMPDDFTYDGSPFDYVVQGSVNGIVQTLGLSVDHAIDTMHFEKPDYFSYPYSPSTNEVGIYLSYGCPYQCAYCTEYKKEWTSLSVIDAVDLIADLVEKKSIKSIKIYDACFGLDPQWRMSFLRRLAERKLACRFWVETRVDTIDEEDLEIMASLNFSISFGIESFSKTMLRIMKKTNDPEGYLAQFVRLSRKATELHMSHYAFLIFNHPGESQTTVDEFNDFFTKYVTTTLRGRYLVLFAQSFYFPPGSFCWRQRAYFEQTFGSVFMRPEWWKQEADHYQLSRFLIPSRLEAGKPFWASMDSILERLHCFNALACQESITQDRLS
ncbi:MAG TPA: cobalamin-dependent protein [Candidatus Omnitrophota bacterium]|nr:cobalamin-dependent protein [Candidatus Omnitrophota bacterium]